MSKIPLLLALVVVWQPLAVELLEGVVRAHIEVIDLPPPLERFDAVGFVPRAGLPQAELGPCLLVARIESYGFLHHGDDVVVAVLPLRILPDDAEECAVLLVSREHFALGRLEARLVVGEQARRGAFAEELEVVGVDGQSRVDGRVGELQVHVAKRDPRANGKGPRVLRIHGERFVHELLGRFEIERLLELHPSEKNHGVGAMRSDVQRFGENFLRMARVVLVEIKLRANGSVSTRPRSARSLSL